MKLRLALASALLLAVLGLGLGFGLDRSRREAAPVDPAAAGASAAPARSASPLPPAPASAATHSHPPPAPPSAAVAAGLEFDGLAVPPGGLEVCGMGWVMPADAQRWKANPAEGRAWLQARDEALNRQVDLALAQLAARLAAGDERQQVLARLLMGDAEGAAALAAQGRDAMAYGLALRRCGVPTEGSACARLSAQRWAELDVSDARPWLRLLDEAARRRDEPAVDAALAGLAARPRLSRGFPLLQAELLPLLEALPDVAVRINLQLRLIGMDAAMLGGEVSAASKACRGESLQRPGRQPQCRLVARQLLAAADNLLEASIAQKMAERSGVPPEQQAYDGPTLQAAMQAQADQALKDMGPDCASLGRMAEFAGRVATEGELAAVLSLPPSRAASR